MRQIELTKGLVAMIDDADYERVVAAGSWCASITPKGAYALRGVAKPDGGRTTIRLHNFLTGWSFVDHINGDGLDNRRSNLRRSDALTNGRNVGPRKGNSSGYKGVCFDKRSGKWRAQITVNRHNHYLGDYADPVDAALAYDAAARRLHGDFARTNFTETEIAS